MVASRLWLKELARAAWSFKKMHLALILDGNRRWARSRGLPPFFGHRKGLENLKGILRFCARNSQIKFCTAFALSTENLKREKSELENLFGLLENFASKAEDFSSLGIKVKPIGNLQLLPQSTKQALLDLQSQTRKGANLVFAPAVCFGGRDEILRACQRIMQSDETAKNFDEKFLESFLDTAGFPPVDLLVRTGGKKRLSNFLLWEAAYSELFFTTKMWPEFSESDLQNALDFFHETKRNFGK